MAAAASARIFLSPQDTHMHAHSDSSTGQTKSTATRSADSSWRSNSPEAARPPMPRKAKGSAAPDNPQLRSLHRMRESGDRQFVAALARGLAILRCFRSGDRYLGNQEIARRTGLAKPTVSRLTHTLKRIGFLSHSKAREEYALGPGVLALGHTYLAALNMRELARPFMQEMADFAQATI